MGSLLTERDTLPLGLSASRWHGISVNREGHIVIRPVSISLAWDLCQQRGTHCHWACQHLVGMGSLSTERDTLSLGLSASRWHGISVNREGHIVIGPVSISLAWDLCQQRGTHCHWACQHLVGMGSLSTERDTLSLGLSASRWRGISVNREGHMVIRPVSILLAWDLCQQRGTHGH